MEIEKVDHIHIAVRDLNKAKELFSKLLGTEFEEYGTSNELGLTAFVDRLGIAITAATKEDSPIAQFIDHRGEGVQTLAIRVKDLEKAIEHWQKCGVRLIGRSELKGRKAAHFHPKDTCGILIELVE
ncbi:VOC family protein [Chloroflexota bacterium]